MNYYVTLGKLLNLSGPQFSDLESGNSNMITHGSDTYVTGLDLVGSEWWAQCVDTKYELTPLWRWGSLLYWLM